VDGIVMGRNAAVDSYRKAHLTWAGEFVSNQISFSEFLVQLEITAATTERRFDVGPPIAVFRMAGTSAEFETNRHGTCP
jgi:hypothetical protein